MEQDQATEQIFDREGKLRSERPKGGTGIVRFYNDKGILSMESWMQNGVYVGYVKMMDTDGTLLMVKFWNNLKYLSKKKYHALCDKDPSLPRFDEINEYNFMAEDLKRERRQQREQAKQIQKQNNTEALEKSEAFCQKLLNAGRIEEVVSWLSNKSKGNITLGELQTNVESLALGRKLYMLGAEKVIAIEIGSNAQAENSGKLVIVLPQESAKRKSLFRWAGANAREQGFDPDVDIGQKHLFVMLDKDCGFNPPAEKPNCHQFQCMITCPVSKLEEIAAAADALPIEEKQQLMLFLASRLRANGLKKPELRKFSREHLHAWIAEDEADMRRFQNL